MYMPGIWIVFFLVMIVVFTGRVPTWLQVVIVLAGLGCLAPYVIGCAILCLR
jgi:hypothetical protein